MIRIFTNYHYWEKNCFSENRVTEHRSWMIQTAHVWKTKWKHNSSNPGRCSWHVHMQDSIHKECGNQRRTCTSCESTCNGLVVLHFLWPSFLHASALNLHWKKKTIRNCNLGKIILVSSNLYLQTFITNDLKLPFIYIVSITDLCREKEASTYIGHFVLFIRKRLW